MAECIVCGSSGYKAKHRCEVDYRVERKHGHDRPEEMVLRLAIRRFERDQYRGQIRAAILALEEP